MLRLIAAFLLTSALFSATAGFGYKRAITIDRTKCGSANSTDFPVLVYGTYSWLATTANGGRVQSADGYDIALFADSNLTTQLKHEVVSYTPATGAIEIWVKVPTLPVSATTVNQITHRNPHTPSPPPQTPPSVPGSGFFIPLHCFGWYLFPGIEGRAVARNIFLDGNTFRDSRNVDKEPLVGDLQFGIAITWRNLRLGYTHVLRTREFKGQGDRRDDFGALSLSLQL